jgi:prepilin-type N-terminal cleavage/methylation domain-containing protein
MALTAWKAAKVITLTSTMIKKGFTLVEMILVIILISLMAGVGGGFAVGTFKSLQVKKAARDFLVAAKFARITAIEQQEITVIEMNKDENLFAVVVEHYNPQSGEVEKVSVKNQFSKPEKFATGVQFEEIQINNLGVPVVMDESETTLSIFFYPDGTSQASIVQIGDGKDHYTVTINPATGRAKLFPGTADKAETGVVDLNLEQ